MIAPGKDALSFAWPGTRHGSVGRSHLSQSGFTDPEIIERQRSRSRWICEVPLHGGRMFDNSRDEAA